MILYVYYIKYILLGLKSLLGRDEFKDLRMNGTNNLRLKIMTDRPTTRRTNQPTTDQTIIGVHREVTIPITFIIHN